MFRFVNNFDLGFLVSIIFIVSLGLLIITSVNPELATTQSIFLVMGICLFLVAAFLDYQIFHVLSVPLYLITIVLLLAVPIFGEEIKGSVTWINFGFVRLQPSELAKISVTTALASFWSTRRANKASNIGLSFLIMLIPALFVFFQPDLGNTLILLAIWIVMAVFAGADKKIIASGALIMLIILPLAWHLLADYQKSRIETFLNPGMDPLGAGYSVIQSQIAVGSGQLFGRGLGHGTQSHLQFLPEHSTDFVFASLAEELGFVGAGVLILAFYFLLSRILKTAMLSSDRFGTLLALGIVGMFFTQAFINIGMNLGILPVTGITLPLVSYGGSSVLTSFAALGMVASIWRENNWRQRKDY